MYLKLVVRCTSFRVLFGTRGRLSPLSDFPSTDLAAMDTASAIAELKKTMAAPTKEVACVVLRVSGETEEITIDHRKVNEVLGSVPTVVGGVRSLDVLADACRLAATTRAAVCTRSLGLLTCLPDLLLTVWPCAHAAVQPCVLNADGADARSLRAVSPCPRYERD